MRTRIPFTMCSRHLPTVVRNTRMVSLIHVVHVTTGGAVARRVAARAREGGWHDDQGHTLQTKPVHLLPQKHPPYCNTASGADDAPRNRRNSGTSEPALVRRASRRIRSFGGAQVACTARVVTCWRPRSDLLPIPTPHATCVSKACHFHQPRSRLATHLFAARLPAVFVVARLSWRERRPSLGGVVAPTSRTRHIGRSTGIG